MINLKGNCEMRAKTVTEYPHKLRIFEDGRIKSKGLVFPLSNADFNKYSNTLKKCLDCGNELVEYKPFKYRCPVCDETFSWSFYTLQRAASFYERHPEYK